LRPYRDGVPIGTRISASQRRAQEVWQLARQNSPAEVRDELFADIFEKKQRIEMARHFTHLREGAAIDNFLAGTSQSPVKRLDKPGVGQGMPGATLARSEAEELAAPRAGSRVRR